MTANVTSSASVSLGGIPTAGRQGARWGACFSRSSTVTYSAVARVSRSASTRPPTRSTLGSNADHGHPPLISPPLGINRLASALPVWGDVREGAYARPERLPPPRTHDDIARPCLPRTTGRDRRCPRRWRLSQG